MTEKKRTELFGWTSEKVRSEVLAIYDTLLSVYQLAKADGIPTYKAADSLAERRLREAAPGSSAG